MQDEMPIGIICLDNFTVEELPANEENKYQFKIDTRNRVWLLQADSQVDMDVWIDCIKHARPWYEAFSAEKEKHKDSSGGAGGGSGSAVAGLRASTAVKGKFRLSMYLSSGGLIRDAAQGTSVIFR
jgi:hypothetical protein